MKHSPAFLIVQDKGHKLQILSTGKTKGKAEHAVNTLLASGVGLDELAVYAAQPIRMSTVTTLEWGARRGRPPKDAAAPKKPAKKVKRPAKPKKIKRTRSGDAQVLEVLRRRGRPPKAAVASADAVDGGNGASA